MLYIQPYKECGLIHVQKGRQRDRDRKKESFYFYSVLYSDFKICNFHQCFSCFQQFFKQEQCFSLKQIYLADMLAEIVDDSILDHSIRRSWSLRTPAEMTQFLIMRMLTPVLDHLTQSSRVAWTEQWCWKQKWFVSIFVSWIIEFKTQKSMFTLLK